MFTSSFPRMRTYRTLLAAVVFGLVSTESMAADPIIIQAESYGAMQGIQVEATTDAGGGSNVGYTDAGDWLSFPAVNLPCSGTYTLQYRVASAATGGTFTLEKAGGGVTYDTVAVNGTGGWQNWVTISHDITLPAGSQAFGIAIAQGGWNLNWFSLTPKCQTGSSSSGSSSSAPVNSVIQAEDYNRSYDLTTGNAGAQYRQDNVDIEATTDTGGGFNVGWIDASEWLEYNVNIPAGNYEISARVASPNGGSIKATLGTAALTATVPNTGGWQAWQSITLGTVNLASPATNLRLDMVSAGFNLNFIQIKTASVCTQNCTADETAKTAIKAMGKGFNLGNMFDLNGGSYGAAKNKIDAYYAKGFRNVRIPITWTENVEGNKLANSDTGAVDLNHPRLAAIRQTVDYALSLPGMYVVINAHHENGLKDNNKYLVLERLWQDITAIFRDRNHRLLFEFLNEPHLSSGAAMPAANLRNMTIRAYNKVRAVDTKRIVIIGGNQWFGANEMANTWPSLSGVGNGDDLYMMAEFHHYAPWSFCGDNQGDYADNWTDADQYGPMDQMAAWANSVGKGMPVYIGEWGVGWGSRYGAMHCNNIRRWYTSFHATMANPRSQATAVWDDGGWFKIFNGSTFDNNLVDCIGGSCAWEGTDRFAGCY